MARFYFLVLSFLVLSFSSTAAGDKIKIYFNNPVDTTFARGQSAVYCNSSLDDTLIAYINKANHTLDIAIYQLSQGAGMSDIAGAINAAYTRGVIVRVIYDGRDNASTSIGLLNSGINTVASPSGSTYNIMHNKFVVIDAGYAADATVWTGSCNWTESMFDRSVNNIVIIQDQPLAQAYTAQFEMMWGSTTATPNAANAKFGPLKTASTAHNFTIDGKNVELYFSPKDGVNDQIIRSINTADHQLFFGVYTFTYGTDADNIKVKYNAGLTVKGIMDDFSINYTAYSTLAGPMGNDLKIYNQSGRVYHSKMLIVDPDYPSSDPLVLTGSHNWSVTADTKNDENTLIIHDADIANQYLQSFAANFKALGGTLSPVAGIDALSDGSTLSVYPNPTRDVIVIDIEHTEGGMIELTDISGQRLYTQQAGMHNAISLTAYSSGIYLVHVATDAGSMTYRIVKM